MKIYHYDSSTGAFAGTSEADPNPRRAGLFLIPAFATEVAPPSVSEKQFACWNVSEWELKDILEPEPELTKKPEKPKLTWEQIRAQRDTLLFQTDWIFAPDVALKNKQAWLKYRQSLRDIPQTFSTPEEVVWPNKPE
jgi:hypothetical protein